MSVEIALGKKRVTVGFLDFMDRDEEQVKAV